MRCLITNRLQPVFAKSRSKIPSNLGGKLNLERKHPQFRFHTWHFHQLQKELQSQKYITQIWVFISWKGITYKEKVCKTATLPSCWKIYDAQVKERPNQGPHVISWDQLGSWIARGLVGFPSSPTISVPFSYLDLLSILIGERNWVSHCCICMIVWA